MDCTSPTVEQITAALRLCVVEEPAGEYPCEQCYLYPYSQQGRMSTGRNCFEHMALDACQLIDRLNDFDQTQSKIALERCQRAEARITDLESQLAASQRETRAAVEDLRLAARESQDGIGVCVTCNHYPADMSHGMPAICNQCAGAGLCMYEWRGPQEAGRGDME